MSNVKQAYGLFGYIMLNYIVHVRIYPRLLFNRLYGLRLVTHQFAVSLYEPVCAGHQHPARVGDAQQGPHYGQTARARREI